MPEQLDEVTIRFAGVADAPDIARVHVHSWQEAYAGIVPAGHLAALDVAERADRWRDTLTRDPAVRTWLAATEAGPVGFATVGPSRDDDAGRQDLELYAMYLEPQAWGQGVARELMRTVLGETPPGTVMTLWVLADAERARHFYRRHGFVADGTERLEPVGGAELLEVRYRRG